MHCINYHCDSHANHVIMIFINAPDAETTNPWLLKPWCLLGTCRASPVILRLYGRRKLQYIINCLVCKHTSAILFADDTNLFSSGKDLKILESTTNSELSNISLWRKVNKLSLNIKKTHYMMFCRRKKLHHDVKLLIDGQAIDEVQKTKFLGIIIDNKLTWKWHIDHITGKISRGIGMIRKARQ